jgi:hypothetical protein
VKDEEIEKLRKAARKLQTLENAGVENWAGSSNGKPPSVDVYVRAYNAIKEYPISQVERYQVRHKYLDDEDLEYQHGAELEA